MSAFRQKWAGASGLGASDLSTALRCERGRPAAAAPRLSQIPSDFGQSEATRARRNTARGIVTSTVFTGHLLASPLDSDSINSIA